jgi:putative component of toxin-antitoxin plasmid stabilization module
VSLIDVERLREIAEVEFADIVVEAFSPGIHELRIILTDGSRVWEGTPSSAIYPC